MTKLHESTPKDRIIQRNIEWLKRQERIAYVLGLFTATLLGFSGNFIDRWVYGEHLKSSYLLFGIGVIFTTILHAFLSVIFLRDKQNDEEYFNRLKESFKD